MTIDDNKIIPLKSNVRDLKSYSIKEDKPSELSDKQIADEEYLKTVRNALEKAINENEEVILFS